MKNRNSLADHQLKYETLLQKKKVAKIRLKEENEKLKAQRKKKIYMIVDMLTNKQIDKLESHLSKDEVNIENIINSIVSLSH
jgi:hypothetical protein